MNARRARTATKRLLMRPLMTARARAQMDAILRSELCPGFWRAVVISANLSATFARPAATCASVRVWHACSGIQARQLVPIMAILAYQNDPERHSPRERRPFSLGTLRDESIGLYGLFYEAFAASIPAHGTHGWTGWNTTIRPFLRLCASFRSSLIRSIMLG